MKILNLYYNYFQTPLKLFTYKNEFNEGLLKKALYEIIRIIRGLQGIYIKEPLTFNRSLELDNLMVEKRRIFINWLNEIKKNILPKDVRRREEEAVEERDNENS